MPSASESRTSRKRLAPKAMRTARSFSWLKARASNRFATLAQAINSTSPTAPINISSAGRTGCTIRPFRDSTATP